MPRERAPVRETWLFVLAREPVGAKTRLSGELSPAMRADLAVAMLADVLAASRTVPFARRVVVTESAAVRDVARAAGSESLQAPAAGTNDAAGAAVSAAVRAGAARVLLLAADLPLVSPGDLEQILVDEANVVIAPDRHRRGTNALLLAPPSAIAPAFGEDSFRAHRERARDARTSTHVFISRGLGTDVDDVNDLRFILGEPGLGPHTTEVLRSVRKSATHS
jgi:2-phospho-L-lactate guanylyltransferase